MIALSVVNWLMAESGRTFAEAPGVVPDPTTAAVDLPRLTPRLLKAEGLTLRHGAYHCDTCPSTSTGNRLSPVWKNFTAWADCVLGRQNHERSLGLEHRPD